jgi:hypothetical protein
LSDSSFYPYPNWPKLIGKDWAKWESLRNRAKTGPKILLASGVGGHVPVATLDSFIAVALTLRGANVHFLLCDKCLPACENCLVTYFPDHSEFAKNGPSNKLCENCYAPAEKAYRSLGLKVHRYSRLLSAEDLANAQKISKKIEISEIEKYTNNGLGIGEHAKAGALRFFAKGALDDELCADSVLQRFLNASLLTAYAVTNLFELYPYECASFHHGIYVPQGLVGEVARKARIRVANWQVAYRKKRFIFSHHETYHHSMLTEPVEKWANMNWNPFLEEKLDGYLKSRLNGSRDWIWFHESPQENLEAISTETGIDFSKTCIGMLTNVMWDAQLHYRANAFKNMLDWVLATIAYFKKRSNLQLLIRIHPAEIRGGIVSRQPIEKEIRNAFPDLPSNIFIISAESRVSTYAVMSQCNACIIYGTKTGVELSSMGIPVIVAGEAWIRNKGITIDASSPSEYYKILDELPIEDRLDEITRKKARMYAYHFFFRRMIPVRFMEPHEGKTPYRINFKQLDDLLPGKDLGTDIICNAILHGTDFIYPEERLENAN